MLEPVGDMPVIKVKTFLILDNNVKMNDWLESMRRKIKVLDIIGSSNTLVVVYQDFTGA